MPGLKEGPPAGDLVDVASCCDSIAAFTLLGQDNGSPIRSSRPARVSARRSGLDVGQGG